MRIFKTKWFNKWAASQRLTDAAIKKAVEEIESGLVDADLGGCLYKKRIGLTARGKRSGARTILAYQAGNDVFFLYGFAKNEKDNITNYEKDSLKDFARLYLYMKEKDLKKAIKAKELIEVKS